MVLLKIFNGRSPAWDKFRPSLQIENRLVGDTFLWIFEKSGLTNQQPKEPMEELTNRKSYLSRWVSSAQPKNNKNKSFKV